MTTNEFKTVMASGLVEICKDELRTNDIKGIIKRCLEIAREDEEDTSLYQNLHLEYRGRSDRINLMCTALYYFFSSYLNVNILDYHLNDIFSNYYFQLDFYMLARIVDINSSDIDIKITSNLDVKVSISFAEGQYNIIFDNNMSNLPIRNQLYFNHISRPKAINIYLPDNLSGNIDFVSSCFESLLEYKHTNQNIKIYFKPVIRNGELTTKFDVTKLSKDIILDLLVVKK